MKDLYLKKNHDYGDSISKTFDEYGLTSFLVRMDDKMNRIKTLIKVGDASVTGEHIEDTLLDLANYAVLALTEIEYRKNRLLQNEEYPKKDLEITYNAMHNIEKCEGTEQEAQMSIVSIDYTRQHKGSIFECD